MTSKRSKSTSEAYSRRLFFMRSFQPKRATQGRQFKGPEPREPAHKRGYDSRWRGLRNKYIQMHPQCEIEGCNQNAREVDHIEPFMSVDDPKRLQWSNLMALCRSHHARKTWKDKRG